MEYRKYLEVIDNNTLGGVVFHKVPKEKSESSIVDDFIKSFETTKRESSVVVVEDDIPESDLNVKMLYITDE